MQPYNNTEPKRDQIKDMFNHIAPHYDTLNSILSFGIHKKWRKRVIREVNKIKPVSVLDMATGTGDMAIALASSLPGAAITGADLSEGMLEAAKHKISEKQFSERVKLVLADAEKLPFTDGSFDAATVAFGVRNFHNIAQGLAEMNRVLKRGGKVFILEFSQPKNKIFNAFYRFYFHNVLPRIGGIISGDRKAYKYLPDSVDEFPDENSFVGIMEGCGFTECRIYGLTGGISKLYIGTK